MEMQKSTPGFWLEYVEKLGHYPDWYWPVKKYAWRTLFGLGALYFILLWLVCYGWPEPGLSYAINPYDSYPSWFKSVVLWNLENIPETRRHIYRAANDVKLEMAGIYTIWILFLFPVFFASIFCGDLKQFSTRKIEELKAGKRLNIRKGIFLTATAVPILLYINYDILIGMGSDEPVMKFGSSAKFGYMFNTRFGIVTMGGFVVFSMFLSLGALLHIYTKFFFDFVALLFSRIVK